MSADLHWTRFDDEKASRKIEFVMSWSGLVEHLREAGPYVQKADCPWLKLAIFGDKRSDKNSLRHNDNVQQISGIEGDYDGEAVTPEQAIALLERHQIRALVYTSPSHRPEAPRWRVLAPLSQELAPERRAHLLARLNGALGGILAPESFTLSQSYYYGRVNGSSADYQVWVTFDDPKEGFCVDELDDLDEIAIGKGAWSQNTEDEPRSERFSDQGERVPARQRAKQLVAALGRKLRTGDGRRELLKSYLGSRSIRGFGIAEVRALVQAFAAEFFDEADPVDAEDIDGIIRWAVGRDSSAETVEITKPIPKRDGAQLADVIAAYQAAYCQPDIGQLYFSLGVVVANMLLGDPVWGLLVNPPSAGKTEALRPLNSVPFCHAIATLTEAALLSGTSKKDKRKEATGGILRQIGEFGILVVKDFTTVLSMNRDSRAQVLAALREIFDGSWVRSLGTDGGIRLEWSGKCGLIGAVTNALDSAHAVISAMGDRFIIYRAPTRRASNAQKAFRKIQAVGQEQTTRREVAEAVAGLIDGIEAPATLTPLEQDDAERLATLCTLVTAARSYVERDGRSREIELIHEDEAPMRLAGQLSTLWHGLRLVGVAEAEIWPLIAKVALDSMPPLRRRLLTVLANAGRRSTQDAAVLVDHPTSTTRRALEDLHAHRIVDRIVGGQGTSDQWELTAEVRQWWSFCNLPPAAYESAN